MDYNSKTLVQGFFLGSAAVSSKNRSLIIFICSPCKRSRCLLLGAVQNISCVTEVA